MFVENGTVIVPILWDIGQNEPPRFGTFENGIILGGTARSIIESLRKAQYLYHLPTNLS
jgi:hypothetical protein